MQQNTKQPQQQKLDLNQAIQQLLASGLSYLQVWSKIAACKQMFKKGTPEFYACLGITPPQYQYQPQPQPQPRPQPQPAKPPQTQPQQAGMVGVDRNKESMKMLLLAGIVLLAVFVFRDSHRRYNELKQQEVAR